VVVYAEPRDDTPEGFMVLEQFIDRESTTGLTKTRRSASGVVQEAKLIDGPVEVGKSYPNDHTDLGNGRVSPGRNSFEACLLLEVGATQRYYGGGAGAYSSKEEVILAFWGLIWVEELGGKGFKVVEIVKQWRH
jgi:hypothetical protein